MSNMKVAPKFSGVMANFRSAAVVGIPVESEESTGIAVDNMGLEQGTEEKLG